MSLSLRKSRRTPKAGAIRWRAAAESLAALVPRERLHPTAVAWAEASPRRKGWAVAFSGGADSLALLLLTWAHWPARRERLCAFHFDHRLRGRDSTNDERFCRRVCAALQIRYASARWTRQRGEVSEAAARSARHAFFRQQLDRRRLRTLWLGHQQDDIAETLLMRIARGSGLAGLAAPRPLSVSPEGHTYARPLLSLKKSELLTALEQVGIPWREDASNRTDAYLRNRMRRIVVPAWRGASGERDALAGAFLSRELIEEDETALAAWLADIAPLDRRGALDLRRLAGKPRGIVRRALQLWLSRHDRSRTLSRQGFAALLMDLERGRETRHSLGADTFAVIKKQRLGIEHVRRKKRP